VPFDEQINHYLSSVEIEVPFFIRSSIFLQLFSIAPINSFMENFGDNSHTASYLTLPGCLCKVVNSSDRTVYNFLCILGFMV